MGGIRRYVKKGKEGIDQSGSRSNGRKGWGTNESRVK